MSLIENEEGARRLVGAIIADVTMYNAQRLAHATDPERDLAEPIEEARQLFQKRVAPKYYMIFEDAVHRWSAEVRARAKPATPVNDKPASPREDLLRSYEDERRAAAIAVIKRQRIIMMGVTLLMVAGIASFFWWTYSSRHHHDEPGKHEGHR
ncbi:MAG TPA: hypothetical protein VGH87_15435 [Polyangiaceae bacterium]